MDVVEVIRECGGIAQRREVLASVGRGDLERAVAAGLVVRPSWGRYALPTDVEGQQAAREMCGVAILVTAAAHWQWRRKWEPRKAQVAVRRRRRVPPAARERFDIRWRSVPAGDVVDGWVTGRVRTVVDCAILLPFDEALAIADSALRSGTVTREELADRAGGLPAQVVRGYGESPRRPTDERPTRSSRCCVPSPWAFQASTCSRRYASTTRRVSSGASISPTSGFDWSSKARASSSTASGRCSTATAGVTAGSPQTAGSSCGSAGTR